ncbi:MAG: hypothetical protein FJZ63_03205, partial [Chlamydiae bacterium]|nr:hypothetical protein [Chlamydiota bacterium]
MPHTPSKKIKLQLYEKLKILQRKICSFKKTTNQSTFKVSVWQRSTKSTSYEIFNLGNNKPQELMTLIHILEKALGKKAIIEFQPMQPGDVLE